MIRRFILFVTLAFSFGGFTFYTSVVVPIGTDVFDATSQGFITRRVTHVLNGSSAVTLVILVWELIASYSRRYTWERASMIGLLSIYSLSLVTLVLLHPSMDSMLDVADHSVDEPEKFYTLHRIYLWVSTFQWLATIGIIGFVCRQHPLSSKNQPVGR